MAYNNTAHPGQTLETSVSLFTELSTAGEAPLSATWSLIDQDGAVWVDGAAVQTKPASLAGQRYMYHFSASVPIPTNAPPSGVSTYFLLYSIEWSTNKTLHPVPVVIVEEVARKYGVPNILELKSDKVEVLWFAPQTYDEPKVGIFFENTLTYESAALDVKAVPGGYLYTHMADTSKLVASLDPFLIAWTGKYNSSLSPYEQTQSESGNLFLITPSIWNAVGEFRSRIERADTVIANQYDLLFTPGDSLTFLKQGKDMFNGIGNPSTITMLNAQDAIRFYWISCALVVALRSQYLAEAVKAFDLTTQAVSLNVDRSDAYSQLADSIENSILEPLKQLKVNLANRGLLSGDGSQDPNSLAFRSLGSVGVGMHPVSNIRMSAANNWLGGYIRRVW